MFGKLFKRRGKAPTIQDAHAALQRGDAVEAQSIAEAIVAARRKAHGEAHPSYASALSDLGAVLSILGQGRRAVECMREACGIEGQDHESRKDRLSYLLNLGYLLQQSGETEEAELVLRQGLALRGTFYGEDHAGFAFGQEPLAGLLLAEGRLDEALEVADAAVEILWTEGHPRVGVLLALRAAILADLEVSPVYDERMASLPDEIFDEALEAVIAMSEGAIRPTFVALVQATAELVEARQGLSEALVQMHIVLSNVARETGQHGARVAALAWLAARFEEAGDEEQAHAVRLALALAHSDEGELEPANALYAEALARAEGLRAGARVAATCRNYGLFLAECEARDEAEPLLRRAVQGSTGEELGRSLVALGIFLQHGEEPEAEGLLANAIEALPPAHPDAICARSHLTALRRGSDCGCGTEQDQAKAYTETIRALILPHAPEGLIGELRWADGLQMELTREPSEEELALLHKLVEHAQGQLSTL